MTNVRKQRLASITDEEINFFCFDLKKAAIKFAADHKLGQLSRNGYSVYDAIDSAIKGEVEKARHMEKLEEQVYLNKKLGITDVALQELTGIYL